MKARELMHLLNKAGYEADTKRGKGAHIIFKKEGVAGIVSVPLHKNVDISPGVLRNIFRETGILVDPHSGEIRFVQPQPRLHLAPGS